ncbi:hypothetical protein ACIQMR_37920 [Streptomyces sp. NPDC091376]|uniref:hypothetical protein n=1 Tax=Streptomyces sp. NPDC091376 TaxID=3365994 RepID=UPI0037FFA8AD
MRVNTHDFPGQAEKAIPYGIYDMADMPQRPRFRPYGQSTLTLVQMRQQRLELRSQDGLDPLSSPHTKTTIPATGSHDLFPGKPYCKTCSRPVPGWGQ